MDTRRRNSFLWGSVCDLTLASCLLIGAGGQVGLLLTGVTLAWLNALMGGTQLLVIAAVVVNQHADLQPARQQIWVGLVKLATTRPWWRRWVSRASDVAVVLLLVSTGWVLTALTYGVVNLLADCLLTYVAGRGDGVAAA